MFRPASVPVINGVVPMIENAVQANSGFKESPAQSAGGKNIRRVPGKRIGENCLFGAMGVLRRSSAMDLRADGGPTAKSLDCFSISEHHPLHASVAFNSQNVGVGVNVNAPSFKKTAPALCP